MKYRYWLYVVIWLAILFVFSSDFFSYYATRKLMFELIPTFNLNISHRTFLRIHADARKVFHVINYAILSWLLLCAWTKTFQPIRYWTFRIALMCIAFCFLYSMLDEWRQSFTLKRTATLLDVVLDTSGAMLTQSVCIVVLWFKKQRDVTSLP